MANSLKGRDVPDRKPDGRCGHGRCGRALRIGVAYSTGTGGVEIDFIEAHKWFNLAALKGNIAAQECRADIAEDMTAREIAEAQRGARAWLADIADRRPHAA